MRAVASELDTGPASLCVYVENRDELLNQMFDAVAATVDLGDEPDPRRWRDQLEELLTRTRDAMDDHPGIARVPLANIPTGPGATRVSERILAILRAGGVAEQSAAWFVDVVFLFVTAASFETSIYAEAGRSHEEIDVPIRERFEALDPKEFPNIVAMVSELTSGDGDERFAFGLRLMIEGLLHVPAPRAATASSPATPASRPTKRSG
jgi:AcrR family transcriptional regulator